MVLTLFGLRSRAFPDEEGTESCSDRAISWARVAFQSLPR